MEITSFLPDMIDLGLSDDTRATNWENYNPGEGSYWLELINTDKALSQEKSIDIADLGRRSEIISDSEVNCIDAPSIPNLLIQTENSNIPPM